MLSAKGAVRTYLVALLISVLLANFVRAFLVQGVRIPSRSMEASLLVGDHVLVNKFIFRLSRPSWLRLMLPTRDVSRGDVLLFRFPADPRVLVVKRCLGLPGERVEISQGQLLIDGEPQDESPYVQSPSPGQESSESMSPRIVPPDHFFMLGDNRDSSSDSRSWGSVHASHIVGKVLVVYWSYDDPSQRMDSRPSVAHLKGVARNFFSRTRWARTLHAIR